VIFLQRTFTSLVHAHAGRTQSAVVGLVFRWATNHPQSSALVTIERVFMKENILINRDNLIQVLNNFREAGENEVSTIAIINNYMGGFHQNRGVDPATSWNAQFGKYLKANSCDLNIIEASSKNKVPINGSDTTTSYWQLLARNV
jgi:hypothetical protein